MLNNKYGKLKRKNWVVQFLRFSFYSFTIIHFYPLVVFPDQCIDQRRKYSHVFMKQYFIAFYLQ
jgi:hypothetical protein